MNNLKTGLSGCKLEIINNYTIRKYSSSKEYNKRLSLQCDKQILFSNLILKNIDTPKVYSFNQENLFSFDMEYVCGVSFYDYFSTSNILDVNFVVETLFEYFDFLITTQRNCVVNSQILEKINSLKEKTSHKKYLSFIENYILKNDIIIPKTFCHGDLTFANILFHKNRLFFIDFLDSYVDSFICDLVKLKQDLYYFWTLRVQNLKSNRVYQIYEYIWKQISNRYSIFIESKSFEILDSLNLLRIEPYLTNPSHCVILNQIIESCDLYEKFNYTNGGKIV